MSNTMTPAEVLEWMDRMASFRYAIDRGEVLSARAAVSALVANHDSLLTVSETLKRECEALKAERDALRKALKEGECWVLAFMDQNDCDESDDSLDVSRSLRKIRAALAGAGHD